MSRIERISRFCRIGRREWRGRGLADYRRSEAFQLVDNPSVGAGLPPCIERRTHLSGKVGGVDDVLDADRDASKWTGAASARGMVDANKCPDARVSCFYRF